MKIDPPFEERISFDHVNAVNREGCDQNVVDTSSR